jgi:Holliday junction resolvase RusA-like endonuclease
MIYKIEINHKLPSLNEFIDALKKNRYYGGKFKRNVQNSILWQLPNIKMTKPITIEYIWYETDYKRDLDNIAAGKKFINDALVEKGIIKNDNYRYVRGFHDNFVYGKYGGVVLLLKEINENEELSKRKNIK